MRNGLAKIVGGAILTILWLLGFMYIRSTLVIDFGAGLVMNFRLFVIIVGLLIIVLYHIFYRSSTEITKLSLGVDYSIAWLALMFFYPFTNPAVDEGTRGAVAFFALVGGLGFCLIWIRFFSDEVSLEG
ncbi:MAG: hypothetical protein E6I93_01160 [Chloroflexi bacterium]|nr:MAG: hypothetical protein E6I93_01160 [Chloroflexota bacterium]TMF50893.1 MAG: hypothetical protein E6I32_03690 [Chloroflexota bacterium]